MEEIPIGIIGNLYWKTFEMKLEFLSFFFGWLEKTNKITELNRTEQINIRPTNYH